MSRGPWRRTPPRPIKVDLGDHKIHTCVCGHGPHWQGVGKCLDCLCDEFRPDEHNHTLGFMSTAT